LHISYFNSAYKKAPAVDPETKAAYMLHYNCTWISFCRQKIIDQTIGKALLKILTEELAGRGEELISLDIFEDRLHITVNVGPKENIFTMMPQLKSLSSERVKVMFPELSQKLGDNSLWQEGHYISTVGEKSETELLEYMKEINRLTECD
jgi:REP element-mobilizing transposase RayT